MEHVTSDLKLIDRLWNDPTYGLDGFSTEGGYIQPIDRDQAVDGNGHANYDGYVLSREIEDDDSPVSELETYQFDAESTEAPTARSGRFTRLRILRKELAGVGFELTIGKSEYLDEAASVDTPGDVFSYRFVSVLPDGRMSWEDVNYDRRKESFDVFREEFLQRLAEKYEYRADDKRRAWLALCDDEEAPLPDPPARKVAGYERMAAAIRGLAKETEEE